MEHHASAGWPTAVMAPAVMPKALDGTPYDPFAIAGADHWYRRGCAARPRAVERRCQQRLSARLAALGRARLDQLGGRDIHGRGGACARCRSGGVPPRPIGWRRAAMPGSAPNAVGGAKRQAAVLKRAAEKAGWGTCHAQGYRARRCHHIRPGTRHADLGRLRRARSCRSQQRCGHGREADDRRRRRHDRCIPMARSRKSRAVPSGASAWRCTKGPSSSKAR